MFKKIIAFAMAVLLALMAAGCYARPNSRGYVFLTPGQRAFNETVDAFFQAVDERDKEAVRELFAPYALEEMAMDFEEEIERLFAFYPGPTQNCERDAFEAYSTGSSDHGVKSRYYGQTFAVACGGITYYCDIYLAARNDKEPDAVGIWKVSMVSEKAICSEGFQFPSEPGVYVVEDAPGDYDTRRIAGYPEVFVPVDRHLTEKEIVDFLEEDASFSHFRERFGEPNSETSRYSRYAYELEEKEGEKRYAILAVRNREEGGKESEAYEKGTVWRVAVHNETEIGWLYVLWGEEKWEGG